MRVTSPLRQAVETHDAVSAREPHDYAPASARRVGSTFTANRSGEAWAVYQNVTWKDREGDWDGDCIRLAHGLTEFEAHRIAERMSADVAARAGVGRAA
jgi:hypothetical protein